MSSEVETTDVSMVYKKGISAEKDQDFSSAAPYGKVKVGRRNLYWKVLLQWRYLPFSDIGRIYRRVEEVNSRTCCCSSDFSVHKLVAVMTSGEVQEILIGESLYRHEPENLMKKLKEEQPQIAYGKPA